MSNDLYWSNATDWIDRGDARGMPPIPAACKELGSLPFGYLLQLLLPCERPILSIGTIGHRIKRAKEAASALLEGAHPQRLVSFGVAGAVNSGLEIGDVVAVRSVSRLDQGIPGPSVPLAMFSAPAYEAAAAALQQRGARLVWGDALTTRGSQTVHLQSSPLENPILEMETAAIAQAAVEYGVPLVSLRGVSDNPTEPLPFDLEMVINENDQLRVDRLIQFLVRHPKVFFQLNRLRRNTARAAENAALALYAALSRLFPDELKE